MANLRIEDCIAQTNEIIDKAHGFAGWIFLKQDDISFQIDRIKGALPQDIIDAGNILRRKEDIIEHAKYEAERIKNDAIAERNRILDGSELLRAVNEEAAIVREKLITECEEIKNKAETEADNIKMQASEEARRLKEGIDRYAEDVLNTLEANLSQQQTTIQNGQRYLEQRKMEIQSTFGYSQSTEPEYQQQRIEEYQQTY